MSYVDKDYYDKTFRGESVCDADFPSLLERASEIVEEMCMYRIRPELMDTYGTDTQESGLRADRIPGREWRIGSGQWIRSPERGPGKI